MKVSVRLSRIMVSVTDNKVAMEDFETLDLWAGCCLAWAVAAPSIDTDFASCSWRLWVSELVSTISKYASAIGDVVAADEGRAAGNGGNGDEDDGNSWLGKVNTSVALSLSCSSDFCTAEPAPLSSAGGNDGTWTRNEGGSVAAIEEGEESAVEAVDTDGIVDDVDERYDTDEDVETFRMRALSCRGTAMTWCVALRIM
ncbi:hypothetical protein BGZ99_002479 [Dissophora globulifera]|uniref:Uncharacterized protein n=1 Tax=Dissophora globulifera TaxID=979702 RepID=A0A9P6RMQ9_9FUNG|nr:hypothetical protein BGZ99_002479 [Dissophora globulifera]